ncbi:rhodanese-like domain-containing protein [Flagellimonas meishanensis]|uniref:rhodanese-like domain-containing protein n=1 Tax=Flagellimonas meishanensis TaxID=2873264 RepID=UPI001CA63952|nr:rhodanese-like domain-containing protein [[Muricauda] meishanensis]
MKRKGISLLFGLIFLMTACCRTKTEEVVQNVDKNTIQTEVIGKEVQLVDVRTAQEYSEGRIDDAVNFDVNGEFFMEQIGTLDKTKPVYLYCKMGGRSSKAAEILKNEGFKEIYNYTGGYNDWSSKD